MSWRAARRSPSARGWRPWRRSSTSCPWALSWWRRPIATWESRSCWPTASSKDAGGPSWSTSRTRPPPRPRPAARTWCGWSRPRTRCSTSRTCGRCARQHVTAERWSRSTTRSPPRCCSSPCALVRTSPCTARPSSSVATLTCFLGLAVGNSPGTRRAAAPPPGVRRRHPRRAGNVPRAARPAHPGVRLEQGQRSAGELAGLACPSPAVTRVRYPGLASHPGHELAAAQMTGFGAVLRLRGPERGSGQRRLRLGPCHQPCHQSRRCGKHHRAPRQGSGPGAPAARLPAAERGL